MLPRDQVVVMAVVTESQEMARQGWGKREAAATTVSCSLFWPA